MSPTPEELQIGEKAYRRVRNYEKNGGQSFYPQMGVSVVCAGLLILAFYLSDPHDHQRIHDKVSMVLPFMPIFIVIMWLQFRVARERYASDHVLLQLLKEKHGESLPWVAEEKELASARELEAAIAKDRSASHA